MATGRSLSCSHNFTRDDPKSLRSGRRSTSTLSRKGEIMDEHRSDHCNLKGQKLLNNVERKAQVKDGWQVVLSRVVQTSRAPANSENCPAKRNTILTTALQYLEIAGRAGGNLA